MADGKAKLTKALELMECKGLDALVIYSRGTSFVLKPFPFYYFTEFRPLGQNSAAVVSGSGEALVLLEGRSDAARAARQSWVQDIRQTSDFVKDLHGCLRQFAKKGIVGIAGSDEMTYPPYEAIRKDWTITAADDVIEEMAREKTSHELENIRKTARIADLGFEAFLSHAREGVKEWELLAETEFAMRAAGADDIFNLMGSGSHNYAMHAPTDRRLALGDVVIGEITPACEGQFVQVCRTVFLGTPGPALVEHYRILTDALAESLKQVRAGNPAALISRAMNGVIGAAGYATYCYPPYMRARGHGFGVGSIAPGAVIDDDTEAVLRENQVVIAHPNQYFPETGYLACGETILVTETGHERLSTTETKLYSREG